MDQTAQYFWRMEHRHRLIRCDTLVLIYCFVSKGGPLKD